MPHFVLLHGGAARLVSVGQWWQRHGPRTRSIADGQFDFGNTIVQIGSGAPQIFED